MSTKAELMLEILEAHRRTTITSGWEGTPNSNDYRNIRRICQCGSLIGRLPYPLKGQFRVGGDDFDTPHLEHVAEVLAGVFKDAIMFNDKEQITEIFDEPVKHFVKVNIDWSGGGDSSDPPVMSSWEIEECRCDRPWRHGHLA